MIYQKTTDMVQIKKCTFEHMTKSYPCKEKSVLDGCMIMRQSIKPEDVQSPFQIEAYALLFCISGEVNIISDLRSYTVTPGTLFVYLPNYKNRLQKGEYHKRGDLSIRLFKKEFFAME